MRPRRLRLRGVTKFRGSLDLDLTDLPPGVVAVVGANGAGKSTVLECLLPLPLYLELPSYPGRLADSVSRGVRDAYIELEQDWAGSTWRHVVQIDPDAGGGRGKTEAFLYQDGVPVAEHGRLADYEAACQRAFPPRSVVYASAFSAQRGTGNFFELDKAARRDLFATLLGLEGLQRQAERAREHRKRVDGLIAGIDARLELLVGLGTVSEETEARVADLRSRLAHLQELEQAAEAALAGARQRVLVATQTQTQAARDVDEATARRTAARIEVERAEAALALVDAARLVVDEQLAHLPAPLGEDVRAQAEARVEESARESTRLLEEGAMARAALNAAESALTAGRTANELRRVAEARVGEARRRLQRAEEARQAVEAYELDANSAAGALGLGPLPFEPLRAAANSELARLRGSQEADRRAVERAAQRRQQAELLAQVPCRGQRLLRRDGRDQLSQSLDLLEEVDCGSCSLLAVAREAEAALRSDPPPSDEAVLATTTRWVEVVALVARLDELAIARRGASALAADVGPAETALTEAQAALGRLADPDPIEVLEADVRRAQEARDRLSDPYRAAAAAERQARAHLEGLVVREADRSNREASLKARQQALQEQRETEARRLDEARQAHETAPDPSALAPALLEANRALADARESESIREAGWRASSSDCRSVREELLGLTAEVERARAYAAEVEQQRAARARLAEAQRGWSLLERGLGRDGVQALLVDGAGPEVSEVLNELLGEVFGSGRFQARLITVQEASGARKQKEVFDVEVLDGQSGDARSADRFSAGERTLISEALKLAIAIYSARRAPHRIETLYRDECDGPLEEALAERYPAMLRRALELGGYRNVLVISHRESVWAQADAVLRVASGQVTLEVP